MLTFAIFQDTFEDANDSAPHDEIVSSSRSLTQRPLSPTTSPKNASPTLADKELQSENEEYVKRTAVDREESEKGHIAEDKDEPIQATSPPLKARKPSKISLDTAALDNVDLEGEKGEVRLTNAKGKYYSLFSTSTIISLPTLYTNCKINANSQVVDHRSTSKRRPPFYITTEILNYLHITRPLGVSS